MPILETPRVVCSIVTFHSAATIKYCLDALLNQTGFVVGENLSLIVTDNDSQDGTAELLEEFYAQRITLHQRRENLGFCRAHNEAIREALSAGAELILVLNPDVRLAASCLSLLTARLLSDPRFGAVCPKLLRANDYLEPLSPPRLDAAGMFITPALRHFDRGSGTEDIGQYEEPRLVFGGSGAAILFSSRFLRDAAVNGVEYFDEHFFAYREDADLAWRGQWLGWQCCYEPRALGWHERLVLPERRAHLPAQLNRLGVRNRFLLQLNNLSLVGNLHCLLPALARNIIVLSAVLLRERSSLGALVDVVRLLPAALRKRRFTVARRRVSALSLGRWFAFRPYSEPLLEQQRPHERLRRVGVVVVNFNSGHALGRCLASLKETAKLLHPEVELTILVVDNGSHDGSGAAARAEFGAEPNMRFLISETNLGYAGAINVAFGELAPEALLVLNPDTKVRALALSVLINTLDMYPRLGAVSPLLIDGDGVPALEFSARHFPTVGSLLAELFGLHRLWPSNPWTAHLMMRSETLYRHYLLGEQPESEPLIPAQLPFSVDQPAGACLLVRATAFQAVGGFDASFYPAWFEDVDFSRRLAAAGWPRAVVSQARVEHEGASSLPALGERFQLLYFTNLRRYAEKHLGVASYLAVRLAFLGGMLLRAGAAALTNRDQARRFLRLAFVGSTEGAYCPAVGTNDPNARRS